MTTNHRHKANVSNIVINDSENITINVIQTITITPSINENDVIVVSIEDLESQVKRYEVLASLLSAIATISPILLPIFQSLIV